MLHFLRPGMFLLKYLRYPQKFALIIGLLVIPLVMAIGLLRSETIPRITFAQKELAGSRYIQRLGGLYERIQASYQASGDPASGEYRAAQQALTGELNALKSDQQLTRDFDTQASLALIAEKAARLNDSNLFSSPTALQQAHSDLMAAVSEEVRRVADVSNLILDPQLDTYYLMSIAVNDTPERIELLARATPLASSRRAPGGVAAQKALVVGGQLDSNRQRTERSVGVALTGDGALRPLLEEPLNRTSSTNQAVITLLQAIGTGQEPPGNASQLAQSAFDSSMDLWRTSLGALDVRLQQRAEDLEQKNSIAMLVAVLMLISILYLLIAFYYSMMHAVRTLDQASKQALAGGTVTLDTRDELGEVVTSFNRVVGELARENAERVASERERTELQEAIIATQAAAIEELSVPIIRLGDGVVMLPLLGTIDAARGSQILQTLLNGVSHLRASLAILDLTGIRTIDTFAIRTLLDAMTGARLLGADVALVGVRADVALTITRLGTDMSEFHCHASLQEALQHYMSPEHALEGVAPRNGMHN